MATLTKKAPIYPIILLALFFWAGPCFALKVSLQFQEEEMNRIQIHLDDFNEIHHQENFGREFYFLLSQESPSKWLSERVKILLPYSKDNQSNKELMSNYGANIYEKSKKLKVTSHVDLKEHAVGIDSVAVDSPRVGLIQISPHYFAKDILIGKNGPSIADSILFSAFLFHEARHSDGHDQHLGFPHSVCPQGSDYAGLMACDEAYNGSYGISAEFLKDSITSCESCNEEEKEVLRLIYFDFQQRINNDNAMTLEKKEQLNDYLNQLDNLYEELYFLKLADQSELKTFKLKTNIIILEYKIKKLQDTSLRNNTFWDPSPEKVSL